MVRFSASNVAKKIKRTFSTTSLNRSAASQEEVLRPIPPTELDYNSSRPPTRRCWTTHPQHHGKFRENLPDADDVDDEDANSITSVLREEFQARRPNTAPVKPGSPTRKQQQQQQQQKKKKPWFAMTDEELRQEYDQCRAKAPDVGPNFLWCDRRDSLDQNAILASMGLKRARTYNVYPTCCPKTGKTIPHIERNENVAVPLHADESEALAKGDVVDLSAPPMASILSNALPPEDPMPKFTLPSPPHWRLKPRPTPSPLSKYRSALREEGKEDEEDKAVSSGLNDDASVCDGSDYSDIFRPLEKSMFI
ncbi:hypothetical protein F5Y00DRAFT_272787 [Daldinia vernicosa]|uniref:uncharacterized protein n=1 Tax=Daldinia vernicosa TaxID=114800 RepID=UPI002007B301|nr:uncharacterized protein F5Y00DRAFT_272787 [Daldinia vernicosa]KAI0845606.1 hypothetical protein F5Y00DRAFT_272787 [Daldinia vernicosa]